MKEILSRFYKGLNQLISTKITYPAILRKLRDYTMIPADVYIANLQLSKRFSKIPGAIVECGTWKGGMIAGMACLLGNNRTYFLFDSFEGLPPAKEIDGEAAIKWQLDANSKDYFNNCTASEQDANSAMAIAGIKNPSIIKGWFNESLPKATFKEGVAILRMDADWYDSTMEILNNLYNQVNKGGVIIIDDYYTWDGCSKAVHDYLSKHKRPERVHEHSGVCYIIKE